MRTLLRGGGVGFLFAILSALCGCSGNPSVSCNLSTVISVAPTSATVDHAAAPPGNQVQFVGYARPTAPPGCAIPAWVAIAYATWSNPDPTDIEISSADDSTNGTAVCKTPTDGSVTLTGTFGQPASGPITKSVQLACN